MEGLRRTPSPVHLALHDPPAQAGPAEEEVLTSSSQRVWRGGLGAVLAGALYALQGVVILFAPLGPVLDTPLDYLVEMVFIVALLGTLAAIAGLHALQRDVYGRLGAGGSLTAFVGIALILISAIATVLTGVQTLGLAFFVGDWAALVGFVLLGAATLRGGKLPRWCGVSLIVGGFPFAVVLGNAGSGLLLGVVWASVGYALLAKGGGSARRPARVS